MKSLEVWGTQKMLGEWHSLLSYEYTRANIIATTIHMEVLTPLARSLFLYLVTLSLFYFQ